MGDGTIHTAPMEPRLVVALAAIATIAFILVDARDAGFRASWWADRRRARRNGAFLLANIVTMAALQTCAEFLEGRVPRLVEWPDTAAGHVMDVAGCLLVAEAVNWISHWLKHRNGWLWRFHLQHHVETRYNINLTLHTHGLEVIVSGCAASSLLMLGGFSRFAVDVFSLTYFTANLYKHCSARLSLGVLDRLVVSPAYHRLHHAVGHDGNFGSVLTIFDVLFGTARFPTGPAHDAAFTLPVGVATKEPFGFVEEMLTPFFPAASVAGESAGESSRTPAPQRTDAPASS